MTIESSSSFSTLSGALILALLASSCPAHLAFTIWLVWLVPQVVVDAVNGVMRCRAGSNKLEEGFEPFDPSVFVPLLAHLDTSTTIVLVRDVRGVFSAFVHHQPDPVFLVEVGADSLILAAAGCLRVCPRKVVLRNG